MGGHRVMRDGGVPGALGEFQGDYRGPRGVSGGPMEGTQASGSTCNFMRRSVLVASWSRRRAAASTWLQ